MASVVLAGIVVASLASVPLLHVCQRAIGFHKTPPQLRAWLVDPERLGKDGIPKGQSIGLIVSIPSAQRIRWVERTDGALIASGVVAREAGTEAHVTLSTSTARPHQWLTVSVSGLPVPLKVWVSK